MKRWEEDRRVKNFRQKIKGAKAAIDTHMPLPSLRVSAPSIQTQSDSVRPSLKLYLQQFQLQQYFSKLEEEGFATDAGLLCELRTKEVEELLARLKLLPGHRRRFDDLLSELRSAFRHPRRRSYKAMSALSPLVLSPRKASRAQSIETKAPASITVAKHSPNQAILDQIAVAKAKIIELETRLSIQTALPNKSQTPLQVFRKAPLFNRKQSERGSDMGASYDSSKLRATLTNIDLDEMCRCVEEAVKEDMQGRYDGGCVGDELRDRFEEVFTEEGAKDAIQPGEVYNFTKNALLRSKAEKEVVVILVVYLQRLRTVTGLRVAPKTWKRLVFVALVLASKIWGDEPYESKNFTEIFSLYSPQELQSMESTFVALIDYHLSVKSSEYAQAYFHLRTFSKSIKRKIPLTSLDAETVLRLQSNAHRAETSLRSPFP